MTHPTPKTLFFQIERKLTVFIHDTRNTALRQFFPDMIANAFGRNNSNKWKHSPLLFTAPHHCDIINPNLSSMLIVRTPFSLWHHTMLKFVLMVNKQGQTRLAEYFDFLSIEERTALEAEIIRKCLSRNEMQVWTDSRVILGLWCPVLVHGISRIQGCLQAICVAVLYCRLRARLWGADFVNFATNSWGIFIQNELGVLEFIHALVETLDKYFENVVCHVCIQLKASHSSVLTILSANWMWVNSRCMLILNLLWFHLQIMFNLEKAHFILNEMIMNGCIVETNKVNVLKPIVLLDKNCWAVFVAPVSVCPSFNFCWRLHAQQWKYSYQHICIAPVPVLNSQTKVRLRY